MREVIGEEKVKEKREFNFTICIRVRPVLPSEVKMKDERCLSVKGDLICVGSYLLMRRLGVREESS